MATVRTAPTTQGSVPVELLDPAHATWADSDLYWEWCRRQGIEAPSGHTWAERFMRGRDAWAVAAGFTIGGRHVDRARLAALGIPHVGAVARAQAGADT